MATGTFYLRPSADISVEHTKVPKDSAAYLLINEVTYDEFATYISTATGGTDSSITTSDVSKFSLSGNMPTDKFKITAVRIVMVHRASLDGSAYNTFGFALDDVEVYGNKITLPETTSTADDGSTVYVWKTNTETYDNNSEIVSYLNSWITENKTFPNLIISTEAQASGTSKQSGSSTVSITQVYVEIDYTTDLGLNIHRKVGDAWVQTQSAYQKQNGVWIEITEDACKEILQNNLLNSGNA